MINSYNNSKKFYIIYATFAFILGIIIGSNVVSQTMLIIAAIFSLISMVLLYLFKYKLIVPTLCLILSLGAISSFNSLKNIDIIEGKAQFTGTIYGEISEKEFGRQSFVINNIDMDGKNLPYSAYCTYQPNKDSDTVLFNGAKISFEGNAYLPFVNLSEYAFDFRMYLKQNNIDFGISGIKNINVVDKTMGNLAYSIRQKLNSILNSALGDYSGFASALLLGEKSNLEYKEKQLYSKLGISHVFSVSGLHVGIIAAIVLAILNKFKLNKLTKAILLVIFTTIYAWITGFSPSTLRTIIMLIILQVANIVGTKYELTISLFISCFVLLIINPLMLYSASFVLSFSAVLGISLVSKRLIYLSNKKLQKFKYRTKLNYIFVKYVINIFLMSLGAQVGLFIPMLMYFGYLSPISLLLNIIIIPLVGILVPILMIALVCYYIPLLGVTVAFIAKALCFVIIKSLSYAKVFESWIINFAQPNIIESIVFVLIVLLLLPGIFRVSIKKKAIIIAASLCIVMLFGIVFPEKRLVYTQINVGQADCAVLIDGKNTIVIDTGETGIELVSLLRKRNRNIDALFLSHLDNDHVGGVESLINNDIKIENVYITKWAESSKVDEHGLSLIKALRDLGVNIVEVVAGDTFNYDKSKLTVLFPHDTPVRAGKDPNDSSMVLLININNCNILSMGDLSSNYEKYAMEKAQILKAGHHGSKTSTSEEFIRYVNPTIAILTSGNRSNVIPHQKVLDNLFNNNIDIYRSDFHGDINICFDKDNFYLETYTNKEKYEQR